MMMIPVMVVVMVCIAVVVVRSLRRSRSRGRSFIGMEIGNGIQSSHAADSNAAAMQYSALVQSPFILPPHQMTFAIESISVIRHLSIVSAEPR